jgi:hypothetical protein
MDRISSKGGCSSASQCFECSILTRERARASPVRLGGQGVPVITDNRDEAVTEFDFELLGFGQRRRPYICASDAVWYVARASCVIVRSGGVLDSNISRRTRYCAASTRMR